MNEDSNCSVNGNTNLMHKKHCFKISLISQNSDNVPNVPVKNGFDFFTLIFINDISHFKSTFLVLFADKQS